VALCAVPLTALLDAASDSYLVGERVRGPPGGSGSLAAQGPGQATQSVGGSKGNAGSGGGGDDDEVSPLDSSTGHGGGLGSTMLLVVGVVVAVAVVGAVAVVVAIRRRSSTVASSAAARSTSTSSVNLPVRHGTQAHSSTGTGSLGGHGGAATTNSVQDMGVHWRLDPAPRAGAASGGSRDDSGSRARKQARRKSRGKGVRARAGRKSRTTL
jgi:uncharacterized membrane protein